MKSICMPWKKSGGSGPPRDDSRGPPSLLRSATGEVDVAAIREANAELHLDQPFTEGSSSFFLPPEAQMGLAPAPGFDSDGGSSSDATPMRSKEEVAQLIDAFRQLRSRSSMYEPDDEPVVEQEVKIWSDDFKDGKHCLASGQLKPRRPLPHMRASELLSGLKQTGAGAWVFEQPINDWPAFKQMVLKAITVRSSAPLGLGTKQTVLWSSDSGKPLPQASELGRGVRAVFMAPMWTSIGWSPISPGFVYWFSTQHPVPRLLVGEDMLRHLEADPAEIANARVTHVHCWAHRYAVNHPESFRDAHTWHTGVLVEWSHRQFTTLLEVAWLNGSGGYGGKSNWTEDKHEAEPALYRLMPDAMKRPFNQHLSEVRLYDMDAKSKDEFLSGWLEAYSSKGELPLELHRFFDPKIYASAPCRLRRCTPSELAATCLNYISRSFVYEQLTANCQTFTTDLFAYLTGSKGALPFSTFLHPGYKQRSMAFVYRPSYTEGEPSSRKKK